jgi:hypothetical protein
MNYAMAEGVWVTQGRWIWLGRERLNQDPTEPVCSSSRPILIRRPGAPHTMISSDSSVGPSTTQINLNKGYVHTNRDRGFQD